MNNNNENSKSKPTNSNEDGKSKPTLPKVRLDKTNKSYKFWVKESNKRNHYLRCIVCADDPDKDDDVLVQSCYGKHSHQNGKSHIEVETKYKKNHPNDFQESKNESEIKDKEDNINVKSIKFEYSLTQFIVDNNIPFTFIDELMPFIKNTITDSEILNNSVMYRQKSVDIVNECMKRIVEKKRDEIMNDHFLVFYWMKPLMFPKKNAWQ